MIASEYKDKHTNSESVIQMITCNSHIQFRSYQIVTKSYRKEYSEKGFQQNMICGTSSLPRKS